jgi:uncharacterized protein YndB with AHSA1/START domain
VSEIQLDLAFPYPPDLVWRALTDRRLLPSWFMETDFVPELGRRSVLWPSRLAGFNGQVSVEVLEVEPPRRLVMAWQSEQLHGRVTWRLEPSKQGSALWVTHTGFFGLAGTGRRAELAATYQRLFGERLPALLAELDAGTVDIGDPPGAAVAGTTEPAVSRTRKMILIGAAVGLTAAAIGIGALVALTGSGDGAAGSAPAATSPESAYQPPEAPSAEVGGVSTPALATPGPETPADARPSSSVAAPSATSPIVAASPSPSAVPLRATYSIEKTVLGSTTVVTITNGGPVGVSGWLVTFKMQPLDLLVGEVAGAAHERQAGDSRFTPVDATRIVPSGGSVTFSFKVTGVSRVISCSIDSRPCG